MAAALTDFDDAYANGAYIADAASYPPRWAADAEAFRLSLGQRFQGDVAYGPEPRNRLDMMMPAGTPRGLVVFVHGGYWRAFDKSAWSWLAAGPLAHGWAVAMPSYTLAPEARISRITAEIAAAIDAAAKRIEGPIRLIGHSAGGHLVSRMNCEDTRLSDIVAGRVEHTISLSGLHDLRPLVHTAMNDDLRLDLAEATAESPALLRARPGTRITCWVGADERPEFIRQNSLLANIWYGLGAATEAVEAPSQHHFNVIDGLADPESPLCRALLS